MQLKRLLEATKSKFRTVDNGRRSLWCNALRLLAIGVLTEPAIGQVAASSPEIRIKRQGYKRSTLPTAGIAGRIAVVMDDVGGIWRDEKTFWFPENARVVNVQEFGARCDGITDDSDAVRAAIAACVDGSGRGGTIVFPSGVQCLLNSTIRIWNWLGGAFEGNNVTLVWGGKATDPMIVVENVNSAVFRNFTITTRSDAYLATAIQSTNGGRGQTPSQNHWYNVVIRGYLGTPTIGKGWQFALGVGGDNNNDLNSFIACYVYYYRLAAWSFEHQQSVNHTFVSCGFGYGAIGVATSLGASEYGGSYIWVGGYGTGSSIADFQIGNLTGDAMKIDGHHSEGSNRFIQMIGGPRIGAKPFLITNFDFQTDSVNSDGYAVILNGPGPFIVSNGRFDGEKSTQILLNSDSISTLALTGINFAVANSAFQSTQVVESGKGSFSVFQHGNVYANASGIPVNASTGYSVVLPGSVNLAAGVLDFGSSHRISGDDALTFTNSGVGSTIFQHGSNVDFQCDNMRNVQVGDGALATTATDGFLYIPTCAGVPTGKPTPKAGAVPMVYDVENNKFFIYNGGWRAANLA